MDLVMIRHAKAGERDAARWPDDDLRPITAEGAAELAAALKTMRRMGVAFDFLVSSPLVRARQTAELVAEAFGWEGPPSESEALGHGCTVAAVLDLLVKFPPDAAVAIVGHEPEFSKVAAKLVGRSGDAAIDLKKGGVIGIRFDGPPAAAAGRLEFLLKPGLLRKLGRRPDRG